MNGNSLWCTLAFIINFELIISSLNSILYSYFKMSVFLYSCNSCWKISYINLSSCTSSRNFYFIIYSSFSFRNSDIIWIYCDRSLTFSNYLNSNSSISSYFLWNCNGCSIITTISSWIKCYSISGNFISLFYCWSISIWLSISYCYRTIW
jgi:hypothetical protein